MMFTVMTMMTAAIYMSDCYYTAVMSSVYVTVLAAIYRYLLTSDFISLISIFISEPLVMCTYICLYMCE